MVAAWYTMVKSNALWYYHGTDYYTMVQPLHAWTFTMVLQYHGMLGSWVYCGKLNAH